MIRIQNDGIKKMFVPFIMKGKREPSVVDEAASILWQINKGTGVNTVIPEQVNSTDETVAALRKINSGE